MDEKIQGWRGIQFLKLKTCRRILYQYKTSPEREHFGTVSLLNGIHAVKTKREPFKFTFIRNILVPLQDSFLRKAKIGRPRCGTGEHARQCVEQKVMKG